MSKGTRLILVRTGIVLDMDGGGLGRSFDSHCTLLIIKKNLNVSPVLHESG